MKSVGRKILLFGLSAMLSVSLAACGSKEESTGETSAAAKTDDGGVTAGGAYTAGTYTATAKGNNGDVTVEVTFDSDAIKSIKIKEHGETPGISDAPIAKIPESIIANQSLKIDAITGATNTSNAILNAVADAVNQAGGDVEALKNVEVADNEAAGEAVVKEADVIVVGAGGAGLAAAVSAAEEGASVIVIEKNAYIGGNTVRTGGGYASCDPEAISIHEMTDGQMAEIEGLIARETDNDVVKSWQKKVAEDIEAYKAEGKTQVYDSLEYMSLQYFFRFSQAADPELLYDLVSKSKPTKEWLGELGFDWTDSPSLLLGDTWPRWFSSVSAHGGNLFVSVFTDEIEEKNYNVEIIKEVRAGELLIADGRVVGVKGTASDAYPFIGTGTNLYVNKEGKRFVNELSDRDTLSNAALAQTDGIFYMVCDKNNAGISEDGTTYGGQDIQDLLDAGIVVRADTLEELAELIGVDSATFVETIEKFNEAVKTGVDPEFNRASFGGDFINPDGNPGIFEAPFYAGARTPSAHITKGGLKVNTSAEVIDTDGNAIPGLCAAGEVTGGRTVAGLLEAMTSGRTAGKTVMGK
ncbi:MAG: FAD-dependent oxidoreductase [Lachnospiraceae bacterium]|nr:FAD-dependent oxidoreductase [Lachnospiraceae bacterium]